MWNSRILPPLGDPQSAAEALRLAENPNAETTFVRTRLGASLASRAPITIVHGPPGIGKSILLGHWAEQLRQSGNFAIEFDMDRVRGIDSSHMWRALVEEAARLGWPVDPTAQDAREALRASLITSMDNFYLIVDNVRNVDRYLRHPDVVEFLSITPKFRTVVGARAPGALDLGAAVIGPEKLLFTEDETRRFLNMTFLSISDATVRKVMMMVRGWPGLVSVAVDAMLEARDEHSIDAALSRADEHLAFVLINESGSAPLSTFVRIAMPAAALTYAIGNEDWLLARELVARNWVVLSALHKSTLFRALHTIPRDVIAADPDAEVTYRFLTSNHPTADDEMPLPAGRDELLAMYEADQRKAILRATTAITWFRRGARFGDLPDLCERALVIFEVARRQGNPSATYDLSLGYLNVGVSHIFCGDFFQAERELKISLNFATREQPHDLVAAAAAGFLALLTSFQGRMVDTAQWLEIEESMVVFGPLTRIIRSPGKSARLLAGIEMLNSEAAYRAFEEIDDPLAELEDWPFIAYALCQWHRAYGDAHASLEMIQQAREMDWHTVPEGSVTPVLMAGIETCAFLSLGQTELARKAIAPIDHPLADNIKVRIQVADDDYSVATDSRDFARWAQVPRGPSVRVERLLLAFMAHDALRNRSAAVSALRQALAVSESSGSYRSYLFVPRRLFESYVVDVPAIATVIEAVESSGVNFELDPESPAVELSVREVDVVRSLAVNPTYARVAEQLFVSTSTIKTHVAAIHKKLGTRERAELLRVAASLGLLD